MIAYLDAPSGISGDMFLGCLVDAGWPIDQLRHTIESIHLPAEEWSVDAKSVQKGLFRATLVDVVAKEGHVHRHLRHVREIIEAGDLPQPVKDRAIRVFTRLAEAEAKVHGTTVEKVHFHEVGAVDAIIDIVGAVAGLHALGIESFHASPLPMGRGWVQSAHGRIPLPAPATLEILAAAGAPTCPAPGEGELVTPTGAALLAELAHFSQPELELARIGLGAGRKDFDWPNVARLWLGQPIQAAPLVQLETNIDDMNPELYAPAIDRLLDAGALDVWLTPVQMKKGRPAIVLSVLAQQADQEKLSRMLLRETTTLGVRAIPVRHRIKAQRQIREVTTPHGQVRAKLKLLDGQIIGAMPEFEDCRTLAERSGTPVREVYEAALLAARQAIGHPQASPVDGHCPHSHHHDHEHGHSHSHS